MISAFPIPANLCGHVGGRPVTKITTTPGGRWACCFSSPLPMVVLAVACLTFWWIPVSGRALAAACETLDRSAQMFCFELR
jgi:hypothetical protein